MELRLVHFLCILRGAHLMPRRTKLVQDSSAALLSVCESREDGRHIDGPGSR
jgi:hypothetical protein